jgi:hypothetical protein
MFGKWVPTDALKYGLIGLGFLLAFLSYTLLASEQRKSSPRKEIFLPIYLFMAFSLCVMALGLFGQTQAQTSPIARGRTMPDSSFEGNWHFSGADVEFEPAHFMPRFSYRGNLDLRLSGDTLYFSGKVETHSANDDEFLGTAQLSGQGPVSNNQVAAYYDYTNERVQGFGTAFMQFDYAGKEASTYLVFRVTTGEGTVGFVAAKLTR